MKYPQVAKVKNPNFWFINLQLFIVYFKEWWDPDGSLILAANVLTKG